MSKVSFDFTGERFVVTGASSGMGRQIAADLAGAGATVLAIARDVSRLEKLREDFSENIVVSSLDVCNTSELENAISIFVKQHGKLHGGVHAAGVNNITTLRLYEPDMAKKIMDISFWAGVALVRLITKPKYGVEGTATVLFSSVGAMTAEKGQFAYAASKMAVSGAMKSFAKEIVSKKHRINTVMPGMVLHTNMAAEVNEWTHTAIAERHLLGMGSPENVSGMVLFLLSDKSKWITGTDVIVDGGYLLGGYM